MRFSRSTAAAVVATALPVAFAQTFTSCNPTEKTCPSDPGLNTATFSADFAAGQNASFTRAAYSVINWTGNGAEFPISAEKQAPTMQTDFYFLFGHVDVKMKAAPGQGIISSIVLESDDLDEIDWEFIGGDSGHVQTNFFGKGNTTLYDRVQYIPVSDTENTWHTYSLDWTPERLQWIIDGTVVRTLSSTDPLTNNGNNYPQTPMRLKLGNWCGGCSGSPPGTVEWAGGATTFTGSAYTMYVSSVNIQNANPANSYTYGDMSGKWQSIKMDGASSSGSSSSDSSTASGASTASTASSAATTAATTGSVAPLSNPNVVANTTIIGSSYSTNTASIAAQNTGASTLAHSTVSAGSTTRTASAGPASATGAAPINQALTGASLFSIALGFFLL